MMQTTTQQDHDRWQRSLLAVRGGMEHPETDGERWENRVLRNSADSVFNLYEGADPSGAF